MKIRTQNPKIRTQNPERATYTRAPKTVNAAQMERFGDYILSHDTTRGGYAYGDDKSGDDWRALCDIFGV